MEQKRRRKALMLDAWLVDSLRMIAEKYGMPLSSYARSLVEAVIEAEDKGFFAPAVLRRAVALEVLLKLGAVIAPSAALGDCRGECLRSEGRRIGSAAVRLGIDVFELIALLAEMLRLGVVEFDRVLLLPGREGEMRDFLIGLAEGSGLNVRFEDGVVRIERSYGV